MLKRKAINPGKVTLGPGHLGLLTYGNPMTEGKEHVSSSYGNLKKKRDLKNNERIQVCQELSFVVVQIKLSGTA